MSYQQYVLGADEEELDRLLNQAKLLDRFSKPFISQFVKPGDHVLEVGCGTGSASQIILQNLDHQGQLNAVELQENYIHYTQQRLAASGYENFKLFNQNIDHLDKDQQYDVIYGRAILHHLNNVSSILKNLTRLLKPGGVIAFEEPIMQQAKTYPHCQPYHDLLSWYTQLGTLGNTDFMIGEKLADLFKEQDLKIKILQNVQSALLNQREREAMYQAGKVLKNKILEKNITNEKAYNNMLTTLEKLVDDDSTLFYVQFCQIMGQPC